MTIINACFVKLKLENYQTIKKQFLEKTKMQILLYL